MTLSTWLAFLTASIVISVSPGSGAVASMTAGMNHGLLRSYWTILGLQLGLLFQVASVGFGVGALAAGSETIFQIIKWFGVAYLVWLAIQCWRSQMNLSELDSPDKPRTRPSRQVWQAFLINVTNPKAYVFMVAVLPQFVKAEQSVFLQFLIMAVTMVVVDILVMNGYAFFASQVARFLHDERHRRRMNQLFAVLFFAAALVLALVQRRT